MEERQINGMSWRVHLVTLPAVLVGLAAMSWALYSLIALDVSPPWYAWAIFGVSLVVSATLRDRVIHRKACPKCGAKGLERSHSDQFVYLICYPCCIRWNTGIRLDDD